ncbi:hypothetical protein ADILRU_1153 [Leifsonia rubra CMS 76R]|nr:hypothetical protein ADILRU_1153 [Leifsonia rubra CMS 76R]
MEDITLAILDDQLTEVSTFLDPVFVNAVDPAAAGGPNFENVKLRPVFSFRNFTDTVRTQYFTEQ